MMMVMEVMMMAVMAMVVHATLKGKEANICNLLAEAEEAVVEGLASSYSLLTQREPQNQVKDGDDYNDYNDGNDDDDDDKMVKMFMVMLMLMTMIEGAATSGKLACW